MSIADLTVARDAAQQSWIACKNAETEAAFKAASRSLVAAKKADEPAVDVDAALANAKRALAVRAAGQKTTAEYMSAWRAKQTAMDWPRCGQDWPQDARERRFEALLSKFGSAEDAALAKTKAVAEFWERTKA
jgi:hypothetical protein